MFDVEHVLQRAVEPTLDALLSLEKRLSRSWRSMMAEIRAHLIEPGFTVEKLLEHVGARDNNWLLSGFKVAAGITPWRLIQEGRLEVAAWLLRNTRWRVGDIVVYVGYVDLSSFTRLFRHWCTLKPTEFREHVAAAEKRAGAIPRDALAWVFQQRFRGGELAAEEARELLAYFERLYAAPAPD